MLENPTTSRRDFLANSTKLAALASVAASSTSTVADAPSLGVVQGPTPRPITPDQVIRFGLIGVGGRGSNLLRGLLNRKNISIKAIADLNDIHQSKAVARIEEKLGETPEVYMEAEDYKKVMARDDVDALIIATPCHLHTRMYLDCFAAGKHFYGEKPLCIDARDADTLVEAQKKNPKVVCQIGFQRRASPRYHEGIRRIHEGEFGRLLGGFAAWNNAWGPLGGQSAPGTRFWFGRRKLSGDWMLEQACHTWDVLCWALGSMPVAASGMGRRDVFTDIDPGRDVTDYYVANLEFSNGVIVDYEHNWCCPRNDDRKFTGVFERFFGPKGGISLGFGPEEGKIYPRGTKAEGAIDIDKPGNDSSAAAIHAFCQSIRNGTPPVSSVVNGRMATYTGLLVRQAVDEKRLVGMSEIGKVS